MKKYIYIPLAILLPILLISAIKIDSPTKLQQYLENYNKKFPYEKTYVQTDKTYYKPSESIFYKGFLVNGTDHKPSATSDIVYVELRDPWGNVIQKNMHKSINGVYDGRFIIEETLAGGLYKLTAYTNWMKNFGEEAFFAKEITVQKVITPRLLLKLDFEKRAYGPGDEVVANLKVTDLDNINTTGSIIKSTVRIGGKVIQTFENKSERGEAAIKFHLPKDLDTSDGILQIIVNDKGIQESITRSIPIVLEKINISFYPEGGDVIENVQSKIAFEALNEFGKGADVKGEIVNSKGTVVTSFESFHLGMGAFEFTPLKGETYYAKIIAPIGNEDLKPLPKAKESGYALQLRERNNDKIYWDIYAPDNVNVTLIGQTQGKIHCQKPLKIAKGSNRIGIDTKDFPIGIGVFTLFDPTDKEVCERLVFINPDNGLKIDIETNKEIYIPGETANIKIKTTDKNNNPVSASLGLAVVDEQILTMADDKQDNIVSYLLFSSELKGKIQEPNFYFDETEKKSKEAIDYLMLTHGWRRFTWDDVIDPSNKTVTEFAEKTSSIYGYITTPKGKETQADVYLVEAGGRIGKVKTTREGHFVFHNVNTTNNVQLVTKKPNEIHLLKGKPIIAEKEKDEAITDDNENAEIRIIAEEQPIINQEEGTVDMALQTEESVDIQFSNDNIDSFSSSFENETQLDEVVVVAYGTQQKRSLVGSVSVVRESREEMPIAANGIATMLSGAVPGLSVKARDVNPNETQNITIRGTSSVSSGGDPLIIIDGIPMTESGTNAMSLINTSDIESVQILKNASSSAVYGSRAANGVIIIETKKTNLGERYITPTGNFNGISIARRQFYNSSVYYQRYDNPKSDNSTVFWNANIVTSNDGTAHLNFTNNQQSSTYRITVEGISAETGLIGAKTKRIVTQKPLAVDAKMPLFAGTEDIIKIPVILKNSTDEPMVVRVGFNLPSNLAFVKRNAKEMSDEGVVVPANESKTVFYSLKTNGNEGVSKLSITAYSKTYSDVIERSVYVRPIYFPMQFNFSGKDMGQNKEFILPEYIPGTLKAEAISYINVMDELFDGVESIFREPYGCFEQVSSSTFPNIFALQLLKEAKSPSAEAQKRAMKYLETGYRKLAAYEVGGTGGFEWYGGTPAHEVLSAYGLVEFYEMEKVYGRVDKAMMNRTRDFILSRRDGKGGFHQNSGRYGFSGAPRNVNNAYIVYALTETGYANEVKYEYEQTLKEAFSSKDLYRMALMASAAYNMKDMANYGELIALFKEYSAKNEFSKIKINASIVRSYGDPSQRETIAFWMIALLKNKNNIDTELVERCLQFINKGRKGGSFGNTQATSICLQALTKYAEQNRAKDVKGSFCLNVNGVNGCIDLVKMSATASKVKFTFADKLLPGSNVIQLKYSEESYPYGVNISWQSKIPATSRLCPLKLMTNMATENIKVNETVRLSINLKNTKNEGLPMSVAIIGIPGGMSLQPWQLKELQEKGVFDFYEIIKDNLVIYYRELGPSETKIVNLDLKAEIPGTYTSIASSAYVYYMNDHKYWINGMKVEIEE
ncbi:MAG: TonB-dependent receptor plug domain-containing protein [Dysgonomonas sp.]|nr:TonB-dependent receptor plug domain-containing protein [Dysgonomonas sp.]